MLNLKNTLDGYVKNVEVIGNTVQDTNNLANIRSVGDKVEGQELYKIDVVSNGKNLLNLPYTQNNKLVSKKNLHAEFSFKVKLGTTYTFSFKQNVTGNNGSSLVWAISYDKNFNGTNKIFTTVGTVASCTFTATSEVVYFIGGVCTSNEYYDFQLEEGTQATPYEPYKEDKLEILSPVQLEKVGDVADRIICKDGVWGVEKSIGNKTIDGVNISLSHWKEGVNTVGCLYGYSDERILAHDTHIGAISYEFPSKGYVDLFNYDVEGISGYTTTQYGFVVRINKSKLNGLTTKEYFNQNPLKVKYRLAQPQFIPLPHDQQVKLRTFAGQTNIAFLTEIPGQIKAQVPKSLGATVNTHTEQIKDLHNSLERVKKLEETTVSTVETVSNFTTVDATSNGYFEDVKLEGKTLVNLLEKTKVSSTFNKYEALLNANRLLSPSTKYTFLIKNNGNDLLSLYFNENLFENGGRGINIPPNGTYIACISTLQLTAQTVLIRALSNDGTFYDLEGVLLEGDHTNNPPSYFEGLMSVGQDVEEVSVKNVNETLYEPVTVNQDWGSGRFDVVESNVNRLYHSCEPFNVSHLRGRRIYAGLIRDGITYNNNIHFACIFDENKQLVGGRFSIDAGGYVIPHNAKYMRLMQNCGDKLSLEYKNRDTYYIDVEPLTLGKSIVKHQSNKKPLLYYNPTTETWEKPVLREWDTIEKHSDGKYYYHKRSGEVVLNGSENWLKTSSQPTSGNHSRFIITNFPKDVVQAPTVVICDKYNNQKLFNESSVGIYVDKNINLTVDGVVEVEEFKNNLKTNPTTVVYQLAKEEVYECTNIDLMTYSGETNYIINSGAISPKSLLKVHNNISNVVKILQEKVSLLENTFIAGLKSVLSGDMYSLATILYPEDFEQNDNTEQDIMVIPE